jgi:predicted transcriptional regulator
MSSNIFIPSELKEMKSRVESGESPQVSVRELLKWFLYQRRVPNVVNNIRRILNDFNLETHPDFAYAWINERITFAKREAIAKDTTNTTTTTKLPPTLETENNITPEIKGVEGIAEDPTYRIGKLDAAHRQPLRISPDASLSEAITIMFRNNYSQLPVMTSEREVKGVISWKSISKNLTLKNNCCSVRDCMEKHVVIVESDISLFSVINLIDEQDFVLVKDAERKISGIVTVADIGQTFHQLARPFLLLSEIENHIRGIIDGKFLREELAEVRNPGDESREINDVFDLTFGEYVILLEKPERWHKIGLNIDRATFVKDLKDVNQIRNDVMHFDPDGISPDDLINLQKTSRFLQQLRDITKK